METIWLSKGLHPVSASALVPLEKLSNSKTPAGPFQTTSWSAMIGKVWQSVNTVPYNDVQYHTIPLIYNAIICHIQYDTIWQYDVVSRVFEILLRALLSWPLSLCWQKAPCLGKGRQSVQASWLHMRIRSVPVWSNMILRFFRFIEYAFVYFKSIERILAWRIVQVISPLKQWWFAILAFTSSGTEGFRLLGPQSIPPADSSNDVSQD